MIILAAGLLAGVVGSQTSLQKKYLSIADGSGRCFDNPVCLVSQSHLSLRNRFFSFEQQSFKLVVLTVININILCQVFQKEKRLFETCYNIKIKNSTFDII